MLIRVISDYWVLHDTGCAVSISGALVAYGTKLMLKIRTIQIEIYVIAYSTETLWVADLFSNLKEPGVCKSVRNYSASFDDKPSEESIIADLQLILILNMYSNLSDILYCKSLRPSKLKAQFKVHQTYCRFNH